MKRYETFRLALQAHIGREIVAEYAFAKERGLKRNWRADFHAIGTNVLIEVEGGVWTHGRHTRGMGFIADIEKYNSAILLGYVIYRVTPSDLIKLKTFDEIAQLVNVPRNR